jgi:hypothetical protein
MPELSNRTGPFFEHLHYDARVIVYSFLDLPPISMEGVGFALSCHKALAEIEYIAVSQMNDYLQNIRRISSIKLGAVIGMPTFATSATFSMLTEVTVELRFDFVHDLNRQTMAVPRQLIFPLLSMRLDRLKLLYRAGTDLRVFVSPLSRSNNHYKPFDLKLAIRKWMTWNLGYLLGDIVSEIQDIQRHGFVRVGRTKHHFKPIRTRSISLEWSLFAEPSRDPEMTHESLEYPSRQRCWIRRVTDIPCNHPWPIVIRRWSRNAMSGQLEIYSGNRFHLSRSNKPTTLHHAPQCKHWRHKLQDLEIRFSTEVEVVPDDFERWREYSMVGLQAALEGFPVAAVPKV